MTIISTKRQPLVTYAPTEIQSTADFEKRIGQEFIAELTSDSTLSCLTYDDRKLVVIRVQKPQPRNILEVSVVYRGECITNGREAYLELSRISFKDGKIKISDEAVDRTNFNNMYEWPLMRHGL